MHQGFVLFAAIISLFFETIIHPCYFLYSGASYHHNRRPTRVDRERYSDRGASERFVERERGDRSADPRMMERGHSSHRDYPSSARDYNRHYDDEYLVHESTAVRDTRDRERDRDWIERERYQPLAPHQSSSSPHRSGGNNRRVLNAM